MKGLFWGLFVFASVVVYCLFIAFVHENLSTAYANALTAGSFLGLLLGSLVLFLSNVESEPSDNWAD